MEGALKFIDNFKFRPRIKPIVIEGITTDEETGETTNIPTKFDKVSNVIRYMNHWQDEYLRLRREKRTIPYSEEANFQAKIDRIRRISNEIGEFLRSLRGFSYQDFDHLKDSKFGALFDAMGFDGEALKNRYRTLAPYVERVVEVAPEPVITVPDIPEPEDVVDEVKEEVEEIVNDVPKFEIGEIPGLEMLPQDDDEEEQEDIKSDIVAPDIHVDHFDDEDGDEEDDESGAAPSDDEEVSQAPDIFQSAEDFVQDMTSNDEDEDSDEEEDVDASEDEDGEEEDADASEDEDGEEEDADASEDEDGEEEDADASEDEDGEEEDADASEDEDGEEEDVDASEDEDGEEEDADASEDEDGEEEDADASEDEDGEEEDADASEDEDGEEEDADASEDEANDEVSDEEPVVIRTPAMILETARNSIASGDLAVAKENYQLLLTKSEEASIRVEYAGFLQDKLNDVSEAKNHLEELLLQDKANGEVYHRLGAIAEENGEYLAAKNYYERVISVESRYAPAYHSLGKIITEHFENQDFVAKSYFLEAIELDSDNPLYRHDYANFLIKKGEYKKARKQLLEAVDLDEDDSVAYMVLSELYLKHLDKKKKARKYYLKATELNDSLATAEYDILFEIEREDESQARVAEPAAAAPEPPIDAKTVLVTGATSGIGLAIANTFAEQGHRVILTGRRGERLKETQADFQERYGNMPEILEFDVRNHEAATQAFESLSDEWKNIDILINNAGLAKGLAPIHEGSLDHWETMIDTNIKGLLYITRLVSPGMVERSKGHIINIGSSAGKEVYPSGNVYCATKFAVDALTKGMRLDLHKHGIKVTAVNPGHVETEFALVRFDGNEEKAQIYDEFQPLTAQDVAETVMFVATRPAHVNIQDILMYSSQQASSMVIDKSGR
jgi:NADP-dependent 3-hydroxy acid dehydrogenase YdfG/Tfp pilus assembly protein PilF